MPQKILLTSGDSFTDPKFFSMDKSIDSKLRGGWPMWPELLGKELNLKVINTADSGRGNDYIAKAKQLVFGDVGIEGMVAGPSEICIVADNKTELNEITTSMLGQSEHDENSQSVIIK